ncbi:MAG TPA: hypothetical protein VKK31_01140 [Thermoanaerobaculia bacterium]|nr:hypothetical protein [Thermoanaerobaculia bacterium]
MKETRVDTAQTFSVATSPEESEQLRQVHERERFMAAVLEGLADAEAGRLLEDHEVKRLLDEEFGPL